MGGVSGYYISNDLSLLDLSFIFNFLTLESHWGKGKTLDEVRESIQHSVCFGLYDLKNSQKGFGKVVLRDNQSGYIMDVFISKDVRGMGLGKMLMEGILNCQKLSHIPIWELKSRDAQEFYKKLGFLEVPDESGLLRKEISVST